MIRPTPLSPFLVALCAIFLLTASACDDDSGPPAGDAGNDDGVPDATGDSGDATENDSGGGGLDAADAAPEVDAEPDAVEDLPAEDVGDAEDDVQSDTAIEDVPAEDAADASGEDAPEDGALADADVGVDAVEDAVGDPAADAVADADTGADLVEDVPGDTGADAGDVPPDTTGDTGGEEVVCRELLPPVSGVCTVVTGDNNRLIEGTILADQVFVGGQILIGADGIIDCVGCDCAAPIGATVISCGDAVISPGLINAHDHLTFDEFHPADWGAERFEHRNDWRLGRRGHNEIDSGLSSNFAADVLTWAELRHVMSGTTLISGHSTSVPVGFLRNIDTPDRQESLGQPQLETDTFPLGSSDYRGADCSYSDEPTAGVLSEETWEPHVGEGVDLESRNEFLCLSQSARGGIDVTEANGAFIHMLPLLAIDGAEIAAEGTAVVWSPRSNVSLYGHTIPAPMLHRQGVEIALGTDWTPSGSINVQRELVCVDYLNQTYYDGYFSDRDLWAMVTVEAARALNIDDITGSLEVGNVGDVAVYDRGFASNPYRAIIQAGVDDVALVMRAGLPLYGDADLLAAIPGSTTCDVLGDVCGVQKRLCTSREVGRTIAQLQAANPAPTPPDFDDGHYDLFFCGTPRNEPSCVPFRDREFDGIPTASDDDGDGVPDVDDNCPLVFNPPRLVDRGTQADFDGDGEGDVCDPCPMDPDETADCSVFDPADRDNDGVANGSDECPDTYDPLQADVDTDNIGDACDLCPDQSNVGGAPCTLPIYDISQRFVASGTVIQAMGVVTAVTGNGFYMQEPPPLDPDLGRDFSGIFVFTNGAIAAPQVDDIVAVTGAPEHFFDTLELVDVTAADFIEVGDEPAPVPIATDEVPFGLRRANELQSVLVEVTGTVTSAYDVNGDLILNGELVIDDHFHRIDPEPLVNDVLTVRGILRLDFDATRVSPRGPADVGVDSADPRLLSVSPALGYLVEGAVDAETHPPIVIQLDRDAPPGGTEVFLSSGNEDVVTVPASVTVLEDERTATIVATAESVSPDEVPITVTVPGSDPQITYIRVLAADRDPEILEIDPADSDMLLGDVAAFTIRLDVPVDAGGLTLTVEAEPSELVDITQPDPLVEWDSSTEFLVEGLAEGTVTLSVVGDPNNVVATLDIIDQPPVVELVSYTFEGSVTTPAAVVDGVDVTNMAAFKGATSFPTGNAPTAAVAFSTDAWNANDNYFHFTITPEAGGQFGLSRIAFDHRRSNTGPPDFQVQLIIDGGSPIPLTPAGTSGTSFTRYGVDVPAGSQGPFSGSVQIRFAGTGATGGTGTWRIDNVNVDGFVF